MAKKAGIDSDNAASSPGYQNPEYRELAPVWKLCRDCKTGQRAVKQAKKTYLPELSGQTDDEYNKYLLRATFFNATGRTVDGMEGLIFRKKPTVTVPAGMEEWLTDINLAGRSLEGFTADCVVETITVGRAGVLVDAPPAPALQPGTALTVEQARAAALRPYLCMYKAEDILDWQAGRVGNRTILVDLTLRETYTDADDPDGDSDVQIRELTLVNGFYEQVIWRKDAADKWQEFSRITPLMNAAKLYEIPFFFLAPREPDFSVQDSPIEDLAYVNISHYRNSADLENGAHVAGLPTPYVTGVNDDTAAINLGATTCIKIPDPAGKAGFLQCGQEGFASIEKLMDRKEQQMAALGARLIAPEKKGVEAAETAQIRRGGENSVLGALAGAVEMQVKKALAFAAKWGNFDPAKVAFELNKVFLPANMTPQMLTSLVQAYQSGALSEESFFEALQAGDVVSEGLTFQDEQDRKAAGGPPLGTLGRNNGDPATTAGA